jgi:hypothetical protein
MVDETQTEETTTVIEDAAAEGEETASTGDDIPETKPESRFDKRIGQLTGENYALKSDRDYWRTKALDKPEVAKPATVEAPKRPELKDFDNDLEQYADALGEYTEKSINFQANQKAAEITEQGKQARESEAQQNVATQRVQQFNDRSVEFSKNHDDYFDIVANPTLNITQPMTDVVTEMENGPAVVYYLGKHPEVAYRIANKASPAAVALALADIERKAIAQDPVRTNESDAPDPPNTISTGRSTTAGKDPTNPEQSAKMSTDEWMKRRTQQVRKRLNG